MKGPDPGMRELGHSAAAPSDASPERVGIAPGESGAINEAAREGETPQNPRDLWESAMLPTRVAVLLASAAALVGCAAPPAGPPVILPQAGAPTPPVVRRPVPPPPPSAAPTVPFEPPVAVPAGAVYVCVVGSGDARKVTAIELVPKVATLCAKHPEMGPCQYEREVCRRSGGRVIAADGKEITKATEAEYDRKVMRVRFRGD